MKTKRIRLDEHERVYLLDLIAENTKHQGSLMSLAIRKLLVKLGDDTAYPRKARRLPKHLYRCTECELIVRSLAGLYRHTTSKHSRTPDEQEKTPLAQLSNNNNTEEVHA